MTPIIYTVIVMLTFMDGSYVQYNEGVYDKADSLKACGELIKVQSEELRIMFKDSDPAPSMFITGCTKNE